MINEFLYAIFLVFLILYLGGALKLATKDDLGPFKPLNQLSYGDLKKVINNSLKKRLMDLSTQDVENIIEGMLNQLIRGQSLIMMSNL